MKKLFAVISETKKSKQEIIKYANELGFNIDSDDNTIIDEELYNAIIIKFPKPNEESIEEAIPDYCDSISVHIGKYFSKDYPYFKAIRSNSGMSNLELLNLAIDEFIEYEQFLRPFVDKQIIKYRRELSVQVYFDSHLVLDTNNIIYDYIRPQLKYTYSDISKVMFKKTLQDLVFKNVVSLKFDEQFVSTSLEEEILEIVYKSKPFSNPIKIIEFDDYKIETHFSDLQAICLCGGTLDSRFHSIYNKYNRKEILSDEDIFLAHTLAMKILKEHGSSRVNFLLTLPEVPMSLTNVEKVFTQFHGKVDKEQFLLSITLEGDIKYDLYLAAKKDTILIKPMDSEQLIGEIKRTGEYNSFHKSLRLKPVINLFINFFENPMKAIVYFGMKTGKCSFCKRKLTDARSKYYNYGKDCALKFNLYWG